MTLRPWRLRRRRHRLLDRRAAGPGPARTQCGTSNQSIRGFLMRIGPQDPTAASAVWLLAVLVVAGLGFALSARLDRLGQPIAVVAAVGMVAVLVSPVSWIHHWHWGIVVIGAVLGDDRVRARVLAALGVTTVLLLPLPWWGIAWPGLARWSAAWAGWWNSRTPCWPCWPWWRCGGWSRSRRRSDRRIGAQMGVGTPAAPSRVSTARTAQTPAPIRRSVDSLTCRAACGRRRAEPGDHGQGEERADEHRHRVVVADHQRGGEDLRQVAPLGEEQHGEAQGRRPASRRPAWPPWPRTPPRSRPPPRRPGRRRAAAGCRRRGTSPAAQTSTGVRGSRASRPPASTAIAVCTKNARPTPIHTAAAGTGSTCTSVAMKVLSGSSTGAISRNEARTTARSIAARLSGLPGAAPGARPTAAVQAPAGCAA